MKALARQLLAPRERQNKPLGAAMQKHSGGVGLTTSDMNKWLSEIFHTPPSANQLEQYSRSLPVYFAVSLRSDGVARAPMKAYTSDNRGDLQWVGPNHEVQQHLDHMNDWWSHADVWRAVETYLCLKGVSFRWVNKPSNDVRTWEQWVLRPDKVVIVKDPNQYIKGFIYDPHGANFPMQPDEVLWDRYFNPLDEFAGASPLAPLVDIIEMRQEMIKTNRAMFKNGMLSQNLAFMLQGPLSSQQVDDYYQRLEERHSGAENANRPLIMDVTKGNVQNLGFSNKDMEWGEGLRWAAGDILTAYKVREELYPGSQRTTYHNLGEALEDFYRNTVSSEWSLLESGMQERFTPMLPERHRNLILKFDVNEVAALQESSDALSNRLRADVAGGVMTPDEYRAHFGRPPFPNGIGEMPYVPSGTVPLSMLGEQPQLTDGQQETEGPEAAPTPEAEPREEIQALALNGAQIGALLEVIQQVTIDQIAPVTAKALIHAAFPSLTTEQVNQMVDSAKTFEPALEEAQKSSPAAPSTGGKEPRVFAEVRCPKCNGITGKRIVEGSGQYCRRCRKEFVALLDIVQSA